MILMIVGLPSRFINREQVNLTFIGMTFDMVGMELIELARQEQFGVGQKGLARLEVQPIIARHLEKVTPIVRAKILSVVFVAPDSIKSPRVGFARKP